MEKTTTISREVIIHKIYCDECGGYIGESEEYDNGWYESFGEYKRKIYIPEYGWYEIKKSLCDSCQEKVDKEIINTLINLGFKGI